MQKIIFKYLEGSASPEEQSQLLEWLRIKKNKSQFNKYKIDWKNGLETNYFPGSGEKSWNKIQTQILKISFSEQVNSQKINFFFKYAAIFLFVTCMAGLTYYYNNQPEPIPETYTNIIAENGHISKVELPDGSLVWLNSGSNITYNNNFAANNRNIDLEGEAYFQVTKNKHLPFIVNSQDLFVNVLGTKFNVAAYPESNFINIVLEEGKIKLLNKKVKSFEHTLVPGQLAKFERDKMKLSISNVNVSKFFSWKMGIINVYDQMLIDLVKRLEIRYNQKFELEKGVENLHYTFTIKNETLDEVLILMEKISPIRAVQNDDIIVLKLDKSKKKLVDD